MEKRELKKIKMKVEFILKRERAEESGDQQIVNRPL